MYQINVKITGTAPLLMNRFPEEKPKTRKKSGETVYPWRDTAYLMPGSADELGQPGIHIESSMAKAAVQFRVAGRGRANYRDLIQASVLVEPEIIPHHLSLPAEKVFLMFGRVRCGYQLQWGFNNIAY
jgi:hypothetical protein